MAVAAKKCKIIRRTLRTWNFEWKWKEERWVRTETQERWLRSKGIKFTKPFRIEYALGKAEPSGKGWELVERCRKTNWMYTTEIIGFCDEAWIQLFGTTRTGWIRLSQ